jgi:hypothetical protein
VGEDEAEVMNEWKGYESNSEKDALRAQLREELNPTRKPLHKLFKLFSLITVCAALLMGLGQCVGVFFEELGVIDYVLRLYVLLFCLLAILNELDFFSLTRDSKLLRIWITRGLFYVFIGVLGLSEHAASSEARNENYVHRDTVLHFIVVTAWVMTGVGLLYIAMGAMCLKLLYNSLENDYQERVEKAKEVRRTTQRYGGISHDVV